MRGFSSFASDLRSHGAHYDDLAARIPDILDRGVERTAREAFRASQANVPVKKGNLKRSGKVRRLSRAKFELLYTADYSAAVEKGHKPFTVRPKRASALRFVVDGEEIFAMKAEIPRQPGVWYLKRAVEANRDRAGRDIGTAFAHAATQIFR